MDVEIRSDEGESRRRCLWLFNRRDGTFLALAVESNDAKWSSRVDQFGGVSDGAESAIGADEDGGRI